MVIYQTTINYVIKLLEYLCIEQKDVWNFDEIGFRIGCLRGRMLVVPADVKAIYLADPDNRESIIALERCSAGGLSIAPFLILKGDVMLEKYFENKMDNKAKLGYSPTGHARLELLLRIYRTRGGA